MSKMLPKPPGYWSSLLTIYNEVQSLNLDEMPLISYDQFMLEPDGIIIGSPLGNNRRE